MKIVFLTDDYFPNTTGGAARVVFSLAKKMKEVGYDVSVITSVRNDRETGFSEENGIKVFGIHSQYHERWRAWLSIYNPQTVKNVDKILSDIKPDVVHAHNIHYHLSYHSLKIARKYSKKVFLTTHDVMAFSYTKFWPDGKGCDNINYKIGFLRNLKIAKKRFNPFRNFFIRRYLKFCDRIFTVSDALGEALKQNSIPGAVTVHNGLDISGLFNFSNDELENFKAKCGLSGKRIMLLAGRISHGKGVYSLIEILPEIKKSVSGVILFFAGVSEEEHKKILDYAGKFGVAESIAVSGWLDEAETAKAYSVCDFVLVPSLIFDSFPTVNLEAALYKKSVIATCFGGSKEFVVDGKTGYIVNPYDKNALASRIIDLLSDKNKARTFGEAAYERLKNDFSLDKQAKILLEHYK